MTLDRPLVEDVDDSDFSGAAPANDFLRSRLELLQRSPDKKDLCTLAGERPGRGPADRAATSIDDRGLSP
jgi:hypothetical protein